MRIIKKLLLFLVFLLLPIAAFYYLPYSYVRFKKIDFSNIVLYSLASFETQNSTNEQDKAISIYTCIRNNIKQPDNSSIYYSNVLGQSCKYLIARKAYCDNQCNELLELANHINIYGRLVFLYGEDSISKHAVCELKINNKYVMFDPFYGILLRNRSNQLIGLKEITKSQAVFKDSNFDNSIETNNYKRLFHLKYPYKIVKYNQPFKTREEKRMMKIYKYWYAFFGETHRKSLFSYYYKINHVQKMDQIRINKLFH
jgi:hypothetical protein